MLPRTLGQVIGPRYQWREELGCWVLRAWHDGYKGPGYLWPANHPLGSLKSTVKHPIDRMRAWIME